MRISKSVGTEDGVTVATIDYIEPEDMFDKYFLSGDDIPIKSRALVEDDDFDFKMANFDLPEIELDGIKATGNVKLTSGIKASDVVFDLQIIIIMPSSPYLYRQNSNSRVRRRKGLTRALSPIRCH